MLFSSKTAAEEKRDWSDSAIDHLSSFDLPPCLICQAKPLRRPNRYGAGLVCGSAERIRRSSRRLKDAGAPVSGYLTWVALTYQAIPSCPMLRSWV
jgi:hypothetical protein